MQLVVEVLADSLKYHSRDLRKPHLPRRVLHKLSCWSNCMFQQTYSMEALRTAYCVACHSPSALNICLIVLDTHAAFLSTTNSNPSELYSFTNELIRPTSPPLRPSANRCEQAASPPQAGPQKERGTLAPKQIRARHVSTAQATACY